MFKCTKCGECCKKAGKIIATALSSKIDDDLVEEYKKFPYAINKDGSCSMLKGTLCSIYNVRPNVCNAEKVYKMFSVKKCSRVVAEDLHVKGCEIIREW